MQVKVERLGDGPIITPHMDGSMGDNINGPSMIKVPEWVQRPLGRYYLYFAHHDGRYIRLAYADELAGPWRTHEAGVLPLAQSGFRGHIASPDVHVDEKERRFRMYFHGADFASGTPGPAGRQPQYTRLAVSEDGLSFSARDEILGRSYMRTVALEDWYVSMAMPGVVYRSRDGMSGFEQGPTLFDKDMRHCALLLRAKSLLVFYTQVGECPERILLSEIDVSDGVRDWMSWRETPGVPLLEPALDYEGVNQPLAASSRGLVCGPVRQLRDPAIYTEGDAVYLLYAVAGEHGIGLARLSLS